MSAWQARVREFAVFLALRILILLRELAQPAPLSNFDPRRVLPNDAVGLGVLRGCLTAGLLSLSLYLSVPLSLSYLATHSSLSSQPAHHSQRGRCHCAPNSFKSRPQLSAVVRAQPLSSLKARPMVWAPESATISWSVKPEGRQGTKSRAAGASTLSLQPIFLVNTFRRCCAADCASVT